MHLKKILRFSMIVARKIFSPTWWALSNYIKYYEEKPISEKSILIESENGTNLNNTIFSIIQYLSSNPAYEDYTIYISVEAKYRKVIDLKLRNLRAGNINVISRLSKRYIAALASAKYLINDESFPTCFIKKNDQKYIKIWNGIADGEISIKTARLQKDLLIADLLVFFSEKDRDCVINGYMLKNISDALCMVLEEFDGIRREKKIENLCDYFFLNKKMDFILNKIPNNNKENILLYSGNLAQNGITTSLRNLINTIEVKKRNYYITSDTKTIRGNGDQLKTFRGDIGVILIPDGMNLTFFERIQRKLFYKNIIKLPNYLAQVKRRYEQEWIRAYGGMNIHTAIQFCGYGDEAILLYSCFAGLKVIFAHNDMLQEISTRHNQRRDLLEYAYSIYDHVAVVSEDILQPTAQISRRKDNIVVVHNTIDCHRILELGAYQIQLDETTKCSIEENCLKKVLTSKSVKFITIGRFSPEKGHERLVNAFAKLIKNGADAYLVIMGGVSRNGGYEKLLEKISKMGLSDKIILLLRVKNPYPILNACDYFVLSSFYEGFGLVLAEADILGKPLISTDVVGPHRFLKENGGTLVENSEDGLYRGLQMLWNGKIMPMSIDYDKYNQMCVHEFEEIFN